MKWISVVLICFAISSAFSQVQLPKLISDNVVLQRDVELNLHGWASANEKVSLHFDGEVYETEANLDGEWELKLPPQAHGGPFQMKFIASNTLEVKNILFGDVYLCSGQSNMELPMSRLSDKYPDEIETADNSKIRQFTVPDRYDFNTEQKDLESSSWVEANRDHIHDFSGVAYFFAKAIHQEKNIPIGLINSALGGSPVSAWLDAESLKEFPELYEEHLKWKDQKLVDSISTTEQTAISKWYSDLDKKDEGLKNKWFQDSTDKSSWKTIHLPEFISDEDLKDKAGVVWLSKKIKLDKLPESETSKLNLGRLVDMDQVYLNGNKIGETTYQYPPRRYEFKSELLNSGENELVVRLINNGGTSGFVKEKPYHLILDGDTLDVTGEWNYKSGALMADTPGQTFIRWKPVGLYNAMISPLTDFQIKGVLWYQGESDTGNPSLYSKTFPKLIESWREDWNQPELPFLFVQLTNFMEQTTGPQESEWAELREVQRQVNSAVPHTGMAVTIDIGEWNDIHPLNKKDVGGRLALEARRVVYNEDLVSFGPSPVRAQSKKTSIIIDFENIESGWKMSDGNQPSGFTISEDGEVFHKAEVEVLKNKSLQISHKDVKNPKMVRYAWANNPGDANLYNMNELPAVPFELKIN